MTLTAASDPRNINRTVRVISGYSIYGGLIGTLGGICSNGKVYVAQVSNHAHGPLFEPESLDFVHQEWVLDES